MSSSTPNACPSIVTVCRYPVKSMMGEELNAVRVTGRGLLGDRAYALVDAETGMVVSAKNPRKWPGMFVFHAAFDFGQELLGDFRLLQIPQHAFYFFELFHPFAAGGTGCQMCSERSSGVYFQGTIQVLTLQFSNHLAFH